MNIFTKYAIIYLYKSFAKKTSPFNRGDVYIKNEWLKVVKEVGVWKKKRRILKKLIVEKSDLETTKVTYNVIAKKMQKNYIKLIL